MQDNELIAEFMGFELHRTTPHGKGFEVIKEEANMYRTNDKGWVHKDNLEFHSSWEWLMPVMEKIRGIWNTFEFDTPENDKAEDIFSFTKEWFMSADIDSIYNAVVEFIKWYNQGQKS